MSGRLSSAHRDSPVTLTVLRYAGAVCFVPVSETLVVLVISDHGHGVHLREGKHNGGINLGRAPVPASPTFPESKRSGAAHAAMLMSNAYIDYGTCKVQKVYAFVPGYCARQK